MARLAVLNYLEYDSASSKHFEGQFEKSVGQINNALILKIKYFRTTTFSKTIKK